MKELDLIINPKSGIGNFKFGTPLDEIIKIMGTPDEIEDFADDDFFNTKVIYYNDLEVVFFFEGANNLVFSSVNIENHDATLFGEKVFQMTEKDVMDIMLKNGYKVSDITEDKEYGERCLSYEDLNLDFYFDLEDHMDCLNFGVLVSDDGEIIEE